MKLLHYLGGRVAVSIDGLGTERFINICRNNGIIFNSLVYDGCSAVTIMSIKDYRCIRPYVRITGVHTRIVYRNGLPFFINRNRLRQFFIVGIMVFAFINIYMTRFLWKIEVGGNSFYSDKVIIEYLMSQGLHYGQATGRISCYSIERGIRESFDNVTWVSADIKGARLFIEIKENEDDGIAVNESSLAKDITAAADGVVYSIITRSGTPVVKAGDTVKKGDILVMAKVDSANESGEVVETRYVRGDADILIDTDYSYLDTIKRSYYKKVYTGRELEHTRLRIGNRYISSAFDSCRYELYDTVTEYKNVNLYENLTLPINYAFVTFKEYRLEEASYSDEELSALLDNNINNYIKKLKENSIQIISNSVKIKLNSDSGAAQGSIHVREAAVEYTEPIILEKETANERS